MTAGAADTTEPSRLLVILAFGAICVLWGSTYLAIRYTVETRPPFLMAGTRAFVVGMLLFAVVGVRRIRTLTTAHWRAAAVSAGLFFLGCHGPLLRMDKTVDSGAAALMPATVPAWIAILSFSAWYLPLTTRTSVGLLLGTDGVARLVLPVAHHVRYLPIRCNFTREHRGEAT